MLVIVPGEWKSSLPDDVEIFMGGGTAENAERIREALLAGERYFLVGVEGVSDTGGFLAATDHVALFGRGVLAGPNRDDLGPRFPSLEGIYLVPPGDWKTGVVGKVPDWKLATPAESDLLGVDALVSRGVDEAQVVGHGGGRVMLLVRCHGWDEINDERPPLIRAVAAMRSQITAFTSGGEDEL